MRPKNKGGRPTILQKLGATPHDLYRLYCRLGTYEAVGRKLGVTGRSVATHMRKAGYWINRPISYHNKVYLAVLYTLRTRLVLHADGLSIPVRSIAHWELAPEQKEGEAHIHLTLTSGKHLDIRVALRRRE